jgi:hypothetical protein
MRSQDPSDLIHNSYESRLTISPTIRNQDNTLKMGTKKEYQTNELTDSIEQFDEFKLPPIGAKKNNFIQF